MAIVLSGSLILSGSLEATGGVTISGSIASASYAANAGTASYVVNSLTASFVANAVSSSYSLNALTSSNALTASSADTLYVRNNVTALGSITAQTLIVQTVTSSVLFTTGSNIIGSSLSNVQQLTGSVGITGSLSVSTNGTEFQVSAGGVNIGNALTDNHVISGSLRVNPNGLFVSSSGNVGIGATLPVSKLSVEIGNLTNAGQWPSTAIAVYNPTNIGAYSQISFGYTTATTNASAYIGYVSTNQASNGYGDIVFGTRAVSTDTQPSERLRITSGGNFGFGTTTPNRQFVFSNGGAEGMEISAGSGRTTIISYNRATSAWLPLVLTEGTGNVLIGTTTDNGYKLNVNGSIYSNSTIAGSTGNFSTVNASNFKSFVGSTSIAAGATATIYTMDTMGLYTVQASYVGSSIIFCASAIFYAQIYSGNYVKCLDLYDGANIYLFNSGASIQVRNDGFGTYSFSWTILFQPAF
jgi:hypothetical protein